MAPPLRITDRISYLSATKDPLCADVVFVHGDRNLWLFDVGCGERMLNDTLAYLAETNLPCRAVLSHFHPDHISNLGLLPLQKIYLGENTLHYVNLYTGAQFSGSAGDNFRPENFSPAFCPVTSPLIFEDGITLRILPLPNCHAKGSLLLTADLEIAFLGDALAPTQKKGQTVYNAQILKEELDILCKLDVTSFFLSHEKDPVQKKQTVLDRLQQIYALREKNSPYIFV